MSLPPFQLPAYLTPTFGGTRGCYQAGFSDGISLGCTTRFFEALTKRGSMESIQILFTNSLDLLSTEASPTLPLTVAGSVEVNPNYAAGVAWPISDAATIVMPLTFGGQNAIVIPPGGQALSDPLICPFGLWSPGQTIYVNSSNNMTAATVKPAGRYPNSTLYEYSDDGYFIWENGVSSTAVTTQSGTVTGAATQGYVTLPLNYNGLTLYNNTAAFTATVNSSGTVSGTGVSGTINLATGAYSITTPSATPAQTYWKGYSSLASATNNDTLNRPRTALGLNNVGSRYQYCHSGVVVKMARGFSDVAFSIALFGDSKLYGTGNSPDFGTSWADYCVAGQVGVIKLAQPSERASQFATPATRWRRMNIANGRFKRVILAYGTNDMLGGATAAAIYASVQTCAAYLAQFLPNGFNDISVVTVGPRTVSAASQSPISAAYGPGTVSGGSPSVRNQLNPMLYTGVGTYWGSVIDVCAATENNPASQAGNGDGLWKNLNQTYDGTHESYIGSQAIFAMFGAAGTNPHPAFVFP